MVKPALASLLLAWTFQLAQANTATTPAPASQPAEVSPRCALIVDPAMGSERLALVGLLEVKLAEGKRVTLLERSEIDKVIREQQLQSLFSPEATAKRSTLGQLLKADLLVLLRTTEEKGKSRNLDIVVCETKAGLRLRVVTLPPSGKTDQEADQVSAVVDQALVKYRSPVRQILAVPPFVSKDFLHDRDYLRSVYARTIEQTLVGLPGVVVVELAEARAIAAELSLTGQKPTVERPLPHYIIGEYRTAAASTQVTCTLDLSLKRGDQEVDRRNASDLAESDARTFLQNTVRQWLQKLGAGGELARNPDEEARQLVQQAEAFARSASWAEALNLVEAALLVKPDDGGLLARAIELSARLIDELSHEVPLVDSKLFPGDRVEDYLARATLAISLFRTGIEHTERWAMLQDVRQWKSTELNTLQRLGLEGWGLFKTHRAGGDIERRVQAQMDRLNESHREMVLRVLERIIAVGQIANGMKDLDPFLFHFVFCDDATKLRVIRIIQDVPEADHAIMSLIMLIGSYSRGSDGPHVPLDKSLARDLLDPKYSYLIAEVAKLPGRSAREASQVFAKLRPQAEELLDKIERERLLDDMAMAEREKAEVVVYHRTGEEGVESKRIKKGALPAQWAPEDKSGPAPGITYQEVDLHFDQLNMGVSSELLGWLACGSGVDVAWTVDEVFLIKEKGRLQSLCRLPEPSFLSDEYIPRPVQGAWDGRYVWLPARYAKEPCLVLIDPLTEKVRRLTVQDGLPPMSTDLEVAAIAPGKAVVAAAFGRPGGGTLRIDRSWCAVVSIDEQGRVSSRMLLESSKPYKDDGQPFSDDPEFVFRPTSILSFNGSPTSPGRQVALLRSLGSREAVPGSGVLLIMDPETSQTRTAKTTINGPDNKPLWFDHQGMIYFLSDPNSLAFSSLEPPEYKRKPCSRLGAERPPMGIINIVGSVGGLLTDSHYVYLLVSPGGWGIARLGDHSFGWARAKWPSRPYAWQRPTLCSSNHYGLIVLADGVYQVKVSEAVYQQVDKLAADNDAQDAEEARAMQENRVRLARMKAEPVVDMGTSSEPVNPLIWVGVAMVAALLVFLVCYRKRWAS